MHNAAQSYANTAKISLTGRELEAHLLLKAAAKLQAIRDRWSSAESIEAQLLDNRKLWNGWSAIEDDLTQALTYNRKLWTVFVGSVTEAGNPLPKPIRENIANLGMFIFKRTLEIETMPLPEKLAALIDINRNVAAGLRGQD